jgi:hypothetical protein
MTKQQKEVAQLKREIRKLERDKRLSEEKLRKAGEESQYWSRQYNRLLNEMDSHFQLKKQIDELKKANSLLESDKETLTKELDSIADDAAGEDL